MTMRSMPPASSHLAESPVPAPPPMIGTRRFTMSWKRAISRSRSNRAMPHLPSAPKRPELLDQRLGEGRIVDVMRQADEAAVLGRAEILLQGIEQRPVGGRI